MSSKYRLGPSHEVPKDLPDGWEAKQLGQLVQVVQGGRLGLTKEKDYVSWGVPAFSAAGQDGFVEEAEFRNQPGVVLSAIGANCGRCFYAEGDWTTLANVQALLPTEELNARLLYYRTNIENYWERSGSAQPFIKPSSIKKAWIAYPSEPLAQQRIAEILSTVDEAIEQTETLIAKTQQIKAGLMHGLFTRGVTADGQLRPPREEAPQLYKESSLGWIPKEWELLPLGSIADSLIDGPFGSNLKTEHYVETEGVRVVRLQNIEEGEYNDSDKAWISEAHSVTLMRHHVAAGDVLIAALGEDNYPVGRSCCYPDDLPPGINKADCFRLRCKSGLASNAFVSGFLNTDRARTQIRRYEQGVTRRRINLGNLRRVMVTLPSLDEQLASQNALATLNRQHSTLLLDLSKLDQVRRGLMHDLLTGRVPAAVETGAEVEDVAANV